MARSEADREDLMREVVALVRRVELMVDGKCIVAGFRNTGWFSIYFDADPMYQFDDCGQLRRAYVDGLLYRSHATVLAQLQRLRGDHETTLVRRDLTEDLLQDFRQHCHERIRWLAERLIAGQFENRGEVPVGGHLVPIVQEFLQTVLNSTKFLAPAIRR